jgi:hypothetical protein
MINKRKPRVLVDGDSYTAMFLVPTAPKKNDYFVVKPIFGAKFVHSFLSHTWERKCRVMQICSPRFSWDDEPRSIHHLSYFGDDEIIRLAEGRLTIKGKILDTVSFDDGHSEKDARKRGGQAQVCEVYVERDCSLRSEKRENNPRINCDTYIRIDITDPESLNDHGESAASDVSMKNVVAANVAIALVDVRRMAKEGVIRLTSSYEAMAVDILRLLDQENNKSHGTEFHSVPILEQLFPHLDIQQSFLKSGKIDRFIIIRLASDAVLVYRHQTSLGSARPPDESAYLYYSRERPAPIHVAGGGEMIGYSTILASCLAAALAGKEKTDLLKAVEMGVRRGIACNQAYFTKGFCPVSRARTTLSGKERVGQEFNDHYKKEFGKWLKEVHKGGGDRLRVPAKIRKKDANLKPPEVIPCVELNIEEVRSHRKIWTILERKVADNKDADEKVLIEKYKKTATNILTDCSEAEVGNHVPLVHFGKQRLVERYEIEDYLALYNAFLHYAEESTDRPLNIAVFGPPGSGKSRGVKEIVNQVSGTGHGFSQHSLTFNMTQLRSPSELAESLHQIRDQGLKNMIPLVFLDEFDCTFEGRAFGWLKYFLAPMEDGEFWQDGHSYTLGKCVLVFAGGVHRTFAEMNGRLRNPDFCNAKGPDFISRLRGSLNLRGINRSEAEDDSGRYHIRRAVILHSLLCGMHGAAKVAVPQQLMDIKLARAFIEIEAFKHGVRSLRTILAMSDFHPGKTLHPSDLPSKDQLDMHVDARHFRELIDGG